MKVNCFDCGHSFTVAQRPLPDSAPCPFCNTDVYLDVETDDSVDVRTAGFSNWARTSMSSMMSCVFHTFLFVCIGLVSCGTIGDEGEGIAVSLGALPDIELTTSQPSQMLEANEANVTSTDNSTLDEINVDVITSSNTGGSDADSEIGNLIERGGSASGGTIGEIAVAGGASGGAGNEVTFMGITSKGRNICIIADCSGSMAEGTKLPTLKAEILETVKALKPTQKFQVCFFSSAEIPFPRQNWRHPKRDLPVLESWLQQIGPIGGTVPLPAFTYIFQNIKPAPDVVFFMTDGVFDPSQAPQIVRTATSIGGKEVEINTICFESRQGEMAMRDIATQTGGKYRYVPAP
ncbi:MAG: vWA domain-containing protein [Pirellulaceae bacterium]